MNQNDGWFIMVYHLPRLRTCSILLGASCLFWNKLENDWAYIYISQLYPHVFPLSMIIALVSSDKPNSWLLQTTNPHLKMGHHVCCNTSSRYPNRIIVKLYNIMCIYISLYITSCWLYPLSVRYYNCLYVPLYHIISRIFDLVHVRPPSFPSFQI